MAFKDLFSAGATDYARYRPTYPPALFAWLAEVSPGRALALDVGTGNGQAAVALAAHFDQVIGQDPSDKQLGSAQPHPNVRYQVARAEQHRPRRRQRRPDHRLPVLPLVRRPGVLRRGGAGCCARRASWR